MWVITCDQTGNEVDRVESYTEALDSIILFELENDWEYSYSKRWED